MTRIDATASYHLYLDSFKHTANVPDMGSMLVYRDYCWSFTEDVPGKPGWIGHGCINGSLVFKVKFGENPVLTVIAP